MDNEDDEFDAPTISAQSGKLDEQHREEAQIINRLDADPSYTGKFPSLGYWHPTYPSGIMYLENDSTEQLKALEKQLRDLLLIVSLD